MVESIERRLGNYVLTHQLGRGGFADVYYGEHIYLKTAAAIKMLHIHITSDEQAQFLAEARIAARLENPYIVSVLEFGIEKDIPFLVMDYAANGTLRQRYPKATRLTPAQILPYMQQVASALQYTHNQHLVHRDIKPENMLLGSNNTVLLSDFGIALVVQNAQSRNNEQKVVGTIAYMAPEQLSGEPCPASDQYSLGAVIYEWLCGNPPFYGSFAEVAAQHALVPPVPLRKLVPELPTDVEEVVMIALAKEPASRFKNIEAFAKAFEHASTHPQYRPASRATQVELAAEVAPAEEPLAVRTRHKRQFPRRAIVASALGGAGLLIGSALAWKPLSHQLQSLLPPTQAPKKLPVSPPGPGTTLYTYHGHAYIAAMAWMPSSKRIVSAGNSVQIWDATTGGHALIIRVGSFQTDPNQPPTYTASITTMAPSSDGKYIAAGIEPGTDVGTAQSNTSMYIWATDTGRTIRHSTQNVTKLSWSPESTLSASSDSNTTNIQIWNALTGEQLITYKGHTAPVNAIAWSSDGKYIASANGADYSYYADPGTVNIHVWDIATAQMRLIYHGHTDTVNALAWSPRSQLIASASGSSSTQKKNPNDQTVQVWSPDHDKPLLIYHGHSGSVNSVAWSPDGKYIVSGSETNSSQNVALAQIWRAADGQLAQAYWGHNHKGSNSINAVAWSPDGAMIASAGIDNAIQVWKA
jgi:serine/threonine protein kinase